MSISASGQPLTPRTRNYEEGATARTGRCWAATGSARPRRSPRRPGSVSSSRSFWYGTGCDGAPTRTTGASRSQKQCSATCAAISAPKPPNRTASWATTTRLRLRDRRGDRVGVERDERPRVEHLDARCPRPPARARRAARAARARRARRPSRRSPRARRAPCRARSRSAPRARAPARRRTAASARGRSTGLSSWIAAASRPFASNGFDGIATTRPGMCAKSASRLCECCAPRRTPPPPTIRITSGSFGVPPIMKRSFAAWFRIWSNATPAKSENCSSTTGRRPVSAAPIAQPTKPLSVSGVSRIRSAPKRLVQPLGRAEEAADAADVLADHDHVVVGGQLELERLADRGDEPERALARRRRLGVAAVRARTRPAAGRPGSRPRRPSAASIAASTSLGDVALELGQRLAVERQLGGEPRQRIARLPLLDRGRGRARPAGSRASSAACAGTSSARAASAPRRRARARAHARPPPRPRRRRCRRRPRPACRSRRRGRRCPRPRAACASRPTARTGCSRR